jgi:hypothetical protein
MAGAPGAEAAELSTHDRPDRMPMTDLIECHELVTGYPNAGRNISISLVVLVVYLYGARNFSYAQTPDVHH